MAHLDEFDFTFGAIEGAEYAVDTVSRVSIDTADAPCMQSLNANNIAAAGACTVPKAMMKASHAGSARPGMRTLIRPQAQPTSTSAPWATALCTVPFVNSGIS